MWWWHLTWKCNFMVLTKKCDFMFLVGKHNFLREYTIFFLRGDMVFGFDGKLWYYSLGWKTRFCSFGERHDFSSWREIVILDFDEKRDCLFWSKNKIFDLIWWENTIFGFGGKCKKVYWYLVLICNINKELVVWEIDYRPLKL